MEKARAEAAEQWQESVVEDGNCGLKVDYVSVASITEETAGSQGFIFTLLYITLSSSTSSTETGAHTHTPIADPVLKHTVSIKGIKQL